MVVPERGAPKMMIGFEIMEGSSNWRNAISTRVVFFMSELHGMFAGAVTVG